VFSDSFFTDFIYYQFFTFDGLTRTGLFVISWLRWEWGLVNNYYYYSGNNPGWYLLNWLYNSNFLLGWIGFAVVAFMRAEFMWIFTYVLLFEMSFKMLNRYYGSGYGWWGRSCNGNSDFCSNYYTHYNVMLWTMFWMAVVMAAAQFFRYHFPDGEINLWHEFLEDEAAETPFCKWYMKLNSSPTLNMAKYFGDGQNFCAGASSW
jgi:hypothetical protein